MSLEHHPVQNVSTYTYRDSDGTAREVLLVQLPQSALGTDNSYPPPTLTAENLGSWVRRGYFFIGDTVIAQLPRNASELPLDQDADQVTDVFHNDTTHSIDVYYRVSDDQATRLQWDYETDAWTAAYADCAFHSGTVETASIPESLHSEWSLTR